MSPCVEKVVLQDSKEEPMPQTECVPSSAPMKLDEGDGGVNQNESDSGDESNSESSTSSEKEDEEEEEQNEDEEKILLDLHH